MAKLTNPLGENKDLPFGPEARIAGAAGTTLFEVVIWTAVYNTVVEAVKLAFDAAITGDNTNNATLTLNVYRAGVKLGALATVAFTTGQNAVAFEPLDMGALAAAYQSLQAGDVLTLAKTVSGTGLTIPAGLVVVDVREPHWNE